MGTNYPSILLHAHAAGIDVDSRSHLVAIYQNKENVGEFGVYNKDHQTLIQYLEEHDITTIAMENTGGCGARMLHSANFFNAFQ